jgi:hypothetical protein
VSLLCPVPVEQVGWNETEVCLVANHIDTPYGSEVILSFQWKHSSSVSESFQGPGKKAGRGVGGVMQDQHRGIFPACRVSALTRLKHYKRSHHIHRLCLINEKGKWHDSNKLNSSWNLPTLHNPLPTRTMTSPSP